MHAPNEGGSRNRRWKCIFWPLTSFMAVSYSKEDAAAWDFSRHKGRGSSKLRRDTRREFFRSLRVFRHEFSDPERLPSMEAAYMEFLQIFPRFVDTLAVDVLREAEYSQLSSRVCLDYSGFGLFSHLQRVLDPVSSSFRLSYVSANLPAHALYGAAEEGTIESHIRRRIMNYLRINENEYSMVFTASKSCAVKLLAESYRFDIHGRLLTVYDYHSQSVEWMIRCAKEKGAKVTSATFQWPSLRLCSKELEKQLSEKKTKTNKGLFVFPPHSRVTGANRSYQWMSLAQQNHWHVLLDASALGPRDMDAFGLSVFSPDFIISSFYKIFGADPTGFGCLFIKKSSVHSLYNSSKARAVGMVRIIPTAGTQNLDAVTMNVEKSGTVAEDPSTVSSFSGPLSTEDIRERSTDTSTIFHRTMSRGQESNEDTEQQPRVEINDELVSDGSSHAAETTEEELTGDFPEAHGHTESITQPEMQTENDAEIMEEELGDEEVQVMRETEIMQEIAEVEETTEVQGQTEIVEQTTEVQGQTEIGVEVPEQTEEVPEQTEIVEELSEQAEIVEETTELQGQRGGQTEIVEEITEAQRQTEIAVPITLLYPSTSKRKLQEPRAKDAKVFTLAELLKIPDDRDDDDILQRRSSSDDQEEAAESSDGRIVCKALKHTMVVDICSMRNRMRYLVNWLVMSLQRLRHPSGSALVRIYGPNTKYDRGISVAFNLVDWKGVQLEPTLVQRLGDRNHISLGLAVIKNGPTRKNSSIDFVVVTLTLGFVTAFEDMYKLWVFVARFLDADFVEKEIWRYHGLNQELVMI